MHEYEIKELKHKGFDMFKLYNQAIINADVLNADLFDEEFIDITITSPPYNVGMEYGSSDDGGGYKEYLEFSRKWLANVFKWSKPSGRLLLNIPLDKNKGGLQSVGADITTIAKQVGWTYKSTIIWNEGNISRRTAWGSFMSASAPYVIAPVELIVIMYKDVWKKVGGSKISTIAKEDFMAWTNGIWTFNGESKKRVGHPAPFPKELPRRCIKLFSYEGDTVFDPFLGSGTTLIEAEENGRLGIGVDIDEEYCKLALNRLGKEAKEWIPPEPPVS